MDDRGNSDINPHTPSSALLGGTVAARQPMNSTRSAWPAFMSDCRIAVSSAESTESSS
jgi:hypothetical protein